MTRAPALLHLAEPRNQGIDHSFRGSGLVFRCNSARKQDMTTPCQHTSLTIPNDPAYADLAGMYVAEVGRKMGFGATEQDQIRRAVHRSVAHIIEYSFEPGEQATVTIGCERVPEGLRTVITDKGLPFDASFQESSSADGNHPDKQGGGRSVFRLGEDMDEVRFRNRGTEGKETILVKRLKHRDITDYYAACELEPYVQAEAQPAAQDEPLSFTVRLMRPEEAVEVSKCIYKAYGYSYAYEHAYYPERLVEYNAAGSMRSAVAVTNTGDIAGHCGLIFRGDTPRIAEIGFGVVKPEYRSHGCLVRLTEYLLQSARQDGLMGMYGQAVTTHTFSQRTGHKLGLRDCALILGYIPRTVTFRKITEKLPDRGSVLVHFSYLNPPDHVPVYVPPRHRGMVSQLYEHLGVRPILLDPTDSPVCVHPAESAIDIKLVEALDFARLEITRCGRNVAQELRLRVKELCLRRIEVMNLYVDLSQPHLCRHADAIEEMGFFFAGILPGGAAGGDALIYQYLNNVPLDYERIELASQAAHTLKDYIRKRDPNAQAYRNLA
jgi:serine/threonine-protein kinase RsbW